MNHYLSDSQGDLKELGPATIESGGQLLRSHYEQQGKDALFIGFNKSENDFVEIGYIGNEIFTIHSDTIAGSGSLLSRLFAKPIDLRLEGLDSAMEVMQNYFVLSRIDFESYLKGQKC